MSEGLLHTSYSTVPKTRAIINDCWRLVAEKRRYLYFLFNVTFCCLCTNDFHVIFLSVRSAKSHLCKRPPSPEKPTSQEDCDIYI